MWFAVGLNLEHTFNESDESLLERRVENPCWQAFCGYETMQHEGPIHPTSMTKWRQRVGAEKLSLLLQETIAVAVQEKHITHPTDSKLYHKAITKLAAAAKARAVNLRQSYVCVSKKESIRVGRYAHAKQFKRMHRSLKKQRTYLGRLVRDMRRKVSTPDSELETLLKLCERLHAQERSDKHKLYSLHETEVRCIGIGKAHKRYEFGQKVSVATTNRHNWIVGIELCEDNPYDGHTLARTICSIRSIPV
ncbi:MAG: transposase [Planctomycetaceae bacterium]